MTFVFTYASQLIVPFFPLERQCGRDGAHTCRPNAWLLVFGLIFLSAPALSQDRETHVRKNKSDTNQELISEEDVQTARPERQISRLRGATVSRFGGPLEPTQTLINGFTGSRVGVYWDGFSLEDPGGGISDLGQIPMFAAQRAWIDASDSDEIGGALNLTGAKSGLPSLTFAGMMGDQETHRFQLRLQQSLGASIKSVTAIQTAKTQGDFRFKPQASRQDLPWETRGNNDQARQTLLQWNEFKSRYVHQTLLWLFHGHQGGIAGFAANPFSDLRGNSQAWLLGSKTKWPELIPNLQLRVSLRGLNRETYQQSNFNDVSTVESRMTDWAISYKKAVAPLSLSFQSQAQIQLRWVNQTSVLQRLVRLPLSVQQSLFSNKVRWQVWSQILWATDEAPLPMAGALLRIRPLPGTQVKIGGHRKYRIPSLQELYAPSGFVLGNPDLRPEDTLDFFGELNFAKEQLELSGSLTHSWSEDLIFYVNRNAFELAPRNLGETERWIATLKGKYTLMPELRLACGYDAFLSNVRASDAPLPGIPPHQLWAKLSIGAADATRLHVNHAFRSETAGDLFGNLKLAAYHLTDLQVVHPVQKGLRIFLSVDNLFNVGYARDVYFLPLPGRQVFASIEVSL